MSLGFSKENVGSKPYFVDKGVVKSVVVDKGRFNDIQLTIVISKEKKDGTPYDKNLWITGDFEKEGDVVVGWGKTAWKVENAMKVLGVVPDKDGGLIDESGKFVGDLNSMVGKEFYYINYISKSANGKIVYNSWDTIDKDGSKLEGKWINRKNPQFPKNYDPELVYVKDSPPETEVKNDVSEEAPF